MRHLIGPAVLVLSGFTLAGCSSSDSSLAEVEIRLAGDQTFAASGAAVDEGLICDTGTVEWVSGEVAGDELLDEDEFAAAYDALVSEAEAEQDIAEVAARRSLSCADEEFGGTFTVQENLSTDVPVDADSDTVPFGTWEIADGTDSFSDLTGSGDHAGDLATREAVYSGEIGAG